MNKINPFCMEFVNLIVRDEMAEMLAKKVCPAEAEQAESLAGSTRVSGSVLAGFDVIMQHQLGFQWLYFAFYGYGCDVKDRGWIGYGGIGKNMEDARAQMEEFQQWFKHIHDAQGGAEWL